MAPTHTDTHPFCEEHRDTRKALHDIEQTLARIEGALAAERSDTARRLTMLERVVFGACGLILIAVVGALVALVVR